MKLHTDNEQAYLDILPSFLDAQDAENESLADEIGDKLDVIWKRMTAYERKWANGLSAGYLMEVERRVQRRIRAARGDNQSGL